MDEYVMVTVKGWAVATRILEHLSRYRLLASTDPTPYQAAGEYKLKVPLRYMLEMIEGDR